MSVIACRWPCGGVVDHGILGSARSGSRVCGIGRRQFGVFVDRSGRVGLFRLGDHVTGRGEQFGSRSTPATGASRSWWWCPRGASSPSEQGSVSHSARSFSAVPALRRRHRAGRGRRAPVRIHRAGRPPRGAAIGVHTVARVHSRSPASPVRRRINCSPDSVRGRRKWVQPDHTARFRTNGASVGSDSKVQAGAPIGQRAAEVAASTAVSAAQRVVRPVRGLVSRAAEKIGLTSPAQGDEHTDAAATSPVVGAGAALPSTSPTKKPSAKRTAVIKAPARKAPRKKTPAKEAAAKKVSGKTRAPKPAAAATPVVNKAPGKASLARKAGKKPSAKISSTGRATAKKAPATERTAQKAPVKSPSAKKADKKPWAKIRSAGRATAKKTPATERTAQKGPVKAPSAKKADKKPSAKIRSAGRATAKKTPATERTAQKAPVKAPSAKKADKKPSAKIRSAGRATAKKTPATSKRTAQKAPVKSPSANKAAAKASAVKTARAKRGDTR